MNIEVLPMMSNSELEACIFRHDKKLPTAEEGIDITNTYIEVMK